MVIEILEFLRIVIIDNKVIYLQIWSLVHFFVGFLLWKLFKLDIKIVLILLIGFELIEQFLPVIGDPETIIDTLWDVITGLLGYFVAKKDFKFKNG